MAGASSPRTARETLGPRREGAPGPGRKPRPADPSTRAGHSLGPAPARRAELRGPKNARRALVRIEFCIFK